MPVIFAFDDSAMVEANLNPFNDDFEPSSGTRMFLIFSNNNSKLSC